MFGSKEQAPAPRVNPLAEIQEADLRRAENASEILFGLARVLEEYGHNPSVTEYVRSAANAVRDITDLDIERRGNPERDSPFGAWEHSNEIRRALRLTDS